MDRVILEKDKVRFWSYVEKTDTCWNWTGCKHEFGYGKIRMRGMTEKTHRFSYRLHFGDIADGMCVCHRCDNPACVRPDHLFLGTRGDNNRDMYAKGRNNNPTGDASGTRKHPESRPRGENHYYRKHPEKVRRGSQMGLAKFTESEVEKVLHMALILEKGISEIAKLYGVTPPTIGQMVRGNTWKHVKRPEISQA